MVLFPLQAVSRKTIRVTSTTRYRGKWKFPRMQWRCRFSFKGVRVEYQRNIDGPGIVCAIFGAIGFADGP